MRFLAASIAATILASCAPTVTHIVGPDGADWLSIDCRRSQTECMRAAGEQCPRGYDVASSTGHVDQITTGYVNQYGGSVSSVPVYKGTLLVKCR